MSLPLTHAGLSAPGISAALDLKFASTLSLTSSSGITPSFSRASSGTYFGSDGLLKYANVNTILYSEDFTNAYWTKSGISVSGNSTVAPDGKTTADKIVENSAGGIKYGTVSGGFSVTSGTTYCFSVYLKDSGRYLGFATNSTAFPNSIGAVFNPTNGTISNIQPNTTASIQDVGNGWYRCSISGTANASATTNINFGVSNDLNQIYPSYTGNGASGYFLWGFQMETGSTPGTYVPTTNAANSAPRFDHTYNGTSWISRGLLVEEQRTNTVLQSQDFGTTWQLFNTTRSTNVITSPDGTQNADSMTGSAGTTIKGFYQQGLSFSSATATFSVFAKKGTHDKLQICYGGTDSTNYANFDLTNGVVGSFTGSASIVNVGNGWYRCIHSVTGLNATDLYFLMVDSLSSGRASTATTTGTVYLWQAQGELGAFATSAIPTTSASATRSADVCQITGGDFSSFWNASEGSVAAEFDTAMPVASSNFPFILEFDNGSTSVNRISHYSNGTSNKIDIYVVDNSGSASTLSSGSFPSANISTRTAGCFKLNDLALTVNGGAVVTDSSQNMPIEARLSVGSSIVYGSYFLNGHIARLRYFNKRLTNSQLVKLST